MNLARELVAAFCAPHKKKEEYSPRWHRLEHAAALAVAHGLPLIVLGDPCGEQELKEARQLAETLGVVSVFTGYDARKCTLSDVQSLLRRLHGDPEFRDVIRVHLVTDWWHMARVRTYVDGEVQGDTLRSIEFVEEPVRTGPPPNEMQQNGERKGISDYLRKVDDPLFGDWDGKPELYVCVRFP